MPVIAEMVAREQPPHLKEYFMERLAFYRSQSHKIGRDEEYVKNQMEGGK
jgi:DNA polymerase-3 subunit theta